MIKWTKRRNTPYTKLGIKRVTCARCGGEAFSQWQICADKGTYRPLCMDCDIALNMMVLRWMQHPEANQLAAAYAKKHRQNQ